MRRLWRRVKGWFGGADEPVEAEGQELGEPSLDFAAVGDEQLAEFFALAAGNLDEIARAAVEGDVERVEQARARVLAGVMAMVGSVQELVVQLEQRVIAESEATHDEAASSEPGPFDYGPADLNARRQHLIEYLHRMARLSPARSSQRRGGVSPSSVLLDRLSDNGNRDGGLNSDPFWWQG